MKVLDFPCIKTKNSIPNVEESVLFADCILYWLPKQIRISKLSLELANALADDTHDLSTHISQNYTQTSLKVHAQRTYNWTLNRRFYLLLLDIFEDDADLLPKAFRFDMKSLRKKGRRLDWCRPIHKQSGLNKQQRQKFGFQKLSPGHLNLNLSSLVKSRSHKLKLVKWWINGDLQDGVTPLELVSKTLEELQREHQDQKDWAPSEKELRHCMSAFTRKFNPFVSNCVNAYWFRTVHLEERQFGKVDQNKRFIIVKSFEQLVYCVIYTELFRDRKMWDDHFNRESELERIFRDRFKQIEISPYDTAMEYLQHYKKKLQTYEDKSPVGDVTAGYEYCEICSAEISEDFVKGVRSCESCGWEEYLPEYNNIYNRPTESSPSIPYAYENNSKVTDLKKSSYRRQQWEKKIDFFASDLLDILGSNIEISTHTKEKVNVRINKLKDEINRAKTLKRKYFSDDDDYE